jgi:hypothetical protein
MTRKLVLAGLHIRVFALVPVLGETPAFIAFDSLLSQTRSDLNAQHATVAA